MPKLPDDRRVVLASVSLSSHLYDCLFDRFSGRLSLVDRNLITRENEG
ncbi:hypothetical protein ACFLZP_03585 [Patescibacteria group bacterium]